MAWSGQMRAGQPEGETRRNAMEYVGEKFMGENPYSPQAGKLNTSRADMERGRSMQIGDQQQGFADYLQGAVQGRGPTVAGQQMAAGRAQAIQAARSQAASARGGNVALANRMSAGGQAQAVQGANRDAAMLRAQEQISREQLVMQQQQNQRLAELQSRGMSIDEAKAQLASDDAAMQARVTISEGEATRGQGPAAALIGAAAGALSDVRAKENIRPIYSDIRSKEYTQPLQTGGGQYWNPGTDAQMAREDAQFRQDFGAELAQLKPEAPITTTQGDFEKLQAERLQRQQQPVAARPPPQDATSSGLATGMQLGAMLSDARAKAAEQHVRSLSEELDKLRSTLPAQIRSEGQPQTPTPEQSRNDLGPVQPYTYRYKPEAAAAMGTDTNPRAGVMAQDLEQSPAYQASVIETPQGKALDKERLLSANTAEIGGLDKRMKELEAAQAGAIQRVNAPTEKQRPKARAAP